MVTATDDQSDRLSALETGVAELRAEVRENADQTNARLSALETGIAELRTEVREIAAASNARFSALETGVSELRADNRAMNDSLNRHQAEISARLDRYQGEISARIERLYWAIVGVGVAVIVVGGGIIGALIALVLRS